MRKMNPRTKIVRGKMPETRINLPNNGSKTVAFLLFCFTLFGISGMFH